MARATSQLLISQSQATHFATDKELPPDTGSKNSEDIQACMMHVVNVKAFMSHACNTSLRLWVFLSLDVLPHFQFCFPCCWWFPNVSSVQLSLGSFHRLKFNFTALNSMPQLSHRELLRLAKFSWQGRGQERFRFYCNVFSLWHFTIPCTTSSLCDESASLSFDRKQVAANRNLYAVFLGWTLSCSTGQWMRLH